MNPSLVTFFAICSFLIIPHTQSEFVRTQHAKVERKFGMNEASCGLVRFPLRKPANCSRRGEYFRPGERIAKGKLSADGEFPWMVGLFHRWPLGVWYAHFCGGAIINKRWILTAAHCAKKHAAEDIWIKVGSNRLKEGGIWYKTERVEVYSHYGSGGPQSSDVALVRTEADIEYVFDEGRNMYLVNSICLPEDRIHNENDESGQFCGFGLNKEDPSERSSIFLRRTGGVIYGVNEGFKFYVTASAIIFDAQKAEICDGDSGSPLFQIDGRNAVVVGVLSGSVLSPGTAPTKEEIEKLRARKCSRYSEHARVSYFLSTFISQFLSD